MPRESDAANLHTLRQTLARERTSTAADLNQAIQRQGLAYGTRAVNDLSDAARREIFGAGPLQKYLDDPAVTDVLVNGVDEVWVDSGLGLTRVDCILGGPEHLRRLAMRLAAQAGSRLDDSHPSVDGRLSDGTRLHALLHPICTPAAVISLRTLRPQALTLEDLVARGSINSELAAALHWIVENRLNFLVSGATGTGKTTLLSTLLSYVPRNQRIVTIEESREIAPQHPHVVALGTKSPNVEGKGGIDQVELVRNALRMRPDRIVVGECRGAELAHMLTALNTGHEGGCGTIHANAARDVPARLEALGALAGMSAHAVHTQVAAAIDVVIHLRRGVDSAGKAVRYVAEIAALSAQEGSGLVVRPALTWEDRHHLQQGPGYDEIFGS